MITIKPSGPTDARILIVADFPSVEAERKQSPLAGSELTLLAEMLHEAGILATECRIAYLCDHRPYASQHKYLWTLSKKDSKHIPNFIIQNGAYCAPSYIESAYELEQEIDRVCPNLIITLGDAPLHYLTGCVSISKWRGSLLEYKGKSRSFKLIPTYSPAQIHRSWEWRGFAVRDLQRCAQHSLTPEFPAVEQNLHIRPTFSEARARLKTFLVLLNTSKVSLPIACDIETISRHIACVGFAWSAKDAICIPLMDKGGAPYFTLEEEFELVLLMQQVLCHPRIELIGQNFCYDTQHFVRSWGFRPRIGFDTMLAQHVCFPGIPKDLGFLASMYCAHYVYWKDELTDYKKMPADVEGFWRYNAKDCCNTWEIRQVLGRTVEHLGFSEQFAFLQNLNHHVITMMIRGVRIDRDTKDKLGLELLNVLAEREQCVHDMIGFPLNISSPKQMQDLLYTEMGFKPVLDKKTHNPTTNEKALQELASREPLLRPFVQVVNETRSIGVFLSTFIQMRLDHDKRMRCSFNVGGTETFRFSSSGDAFGSGGNLQNIPKGNEEEDLAPDAFVFPNVRKLFMPDPGMTLFDVDLAGADAQVVAWEAEDESLKAIFRSGQKVHAINAKDLYGADAGPDGKKQPYYGKAKMGCHLCLADGHEVLTPHGWIPVQSVTGEEAIVVCSLDGSTAFFERPSDWYHAQDTLEMLEISGQAYHQLITPNHKLSYATDNKGVVHVRQTKDLPASARLPKSVRFSGSRVTNPDLLRLLSAFHADGTVAKNQVCFHLKKVRKIQRLVGLLKRLELPSDLRVYADGSTNIFIAGATAEWLISQGKRPTWDMLLWSRECLQAYVDELPYWDGCISATSVSFSTVVAETAEIVHTLLHLCGVSGNTYPVGNCGGYTVQINNRPLHRLASGSVSRVQYTGGLHCPTVSTGFFLTRYKGKIAVTGNTNYGGKPRTLSKGLGMTMKEAEWFQRRWFDMHPGILDWHREVENSLLTTRSVRNKFGFRRFYFDRIENLLPQALAWIPQSTVALVINKGLVAISESKTELELLLQVHDSLVGQFPTHLQAKLLPVLHNCLRVTIPYPDPLIINTSLDLSTKSWGDLTAMSWKTVFEQ